MSTRRRTLAPRSLLAVEEPALEERQDFLPGEGSGVRRPAVALEHVHVVLERLVRMLERVAELVALEDDVFGTGLVRLAQLRIHDPTDGPDRTGSPLDPDDDPLLLADVVDAGEDPFRIATFA